MNEDLLDELEAMNAIYGEGTLRTDKNKGSFILRLPGSLIFIRLQFPPEYPKIPPVIVGTHGAGELNVKGAANQAVSRCRTILGQIFQPGHVCLFDLLQELSILDNSGQTETLHQEIPQAVESEEGGITVAPPPTDTNVDGSVAEEGPSWVTSDEVTEKKSVFVARCATVESPEQAKQYVNYLVTYDRRVGRATHNIMAWRIKATNDISYQDCDDDGETAAGGRLLHLMQLMDVCNVLVVVSRWYGGILLGPDRFRIINSVAREALVRGGYMRQPDDEPRTRAKGKKSTSMKKR